ncbi:MAG: HEAT repeat domain-containing protein, partial [Chthoniobacteraceae bacterium]
CYLSDGLPEQYRGRHFFSEWGKAGVFVTEVARDGATFRLVSDTKLIEPEKGGDFRPMQLSVAADGSLLIADWGYGGWKSPRVAGAIWRLSWPEAKIAPRLKDESKASVEELIAALGHPDRDQRLRAQGALVQRTVPEAPKNYHSEWLWETPPTLKRLDQVMHDAELPLEPRLHALWAISELSRISLRDMIGAGNASRNVAVLLGNASSDDDPQIRAQALRALHQSGGYGIGPIPEWIADSDPRVRLEAATAMSRSDRSYGDYTRLLADPDRWVRFAACAALREALPLHYSDQISTGADDFKYVGEIITSALLSSDPTVRASAWSVLPSPFRDGAIRFVEKDDHVDAQLVEQLALVVCEIVKPLLSSTDVSIRTRAVTALGCAAYQPVPYDGHWWGTQPVKSPPPLNSVPWVGTAPALAALTAALSDPDAGVRLAAAKAFTQFIVGGPSSVVAQTPGAGGGGGAAGPEASTVERAKSSTTSPPSPAPDQGADGAAPFKALAALHARLSAEEDSAIRRQLIEALGVQKDPQAMDVFLKIALDEKADAEFRDTAIGAVVNIGGDGAKKVIAQLASAQLSPAATRQIITAAGELKVLEAAPALIAHLKDELPGNREFAAKSIQQLGPKSGAGPALIALLADKDGKVQAAAIEALGSFKEKTALPALIALAEKKRSMKETIGALANMPDESAIPVLVETLRDKNTSVRRNAIKALKTMREKAWPQVEALLATGRVPEELVPEIKSAFESGAITRWKMVGVFENVWDAVHPPEKEAVAAAIVGQAPRLPGVTAAPTGAGGAPALQFLTHKYHNAEGKDVGWIDVTADGTEGRVDLGSIFKSNAMVCAYAFTEIVAPEAADAKLFTSADDEIAVWLNGERVLNVSGNHGYEPDKNETPLKLLAGKNQLFVKIGNKGGSWVFHARIPGFDNGNFIKSKETPPDEKQRLFALAARPDGTYVNKGDAAKGEKIFFDPTGPLGGICATCHAVRGKGGQIGPDLGTIAANYKRPDLITSLHEPSKTIALGFEQFIVETKSGEIFAGAVRQETADTLTVLGADAQSHVVKKADVKSKTAVPASIMPQGLTLGLKPQDFTDLLAYLETLTGK